MVVARDSCYESVVPELWETQGARVRHRELCSDALTTIE